MIAPVEPNSEDCCNNGCNPCIFDVYETQMKLFEKRRNENSPRFNCNGISQIEYTEFIVSDETTLTKYHKLIKFQRKTPGYEVWWEPGDHFILLLKSNNKKSSRAYSPIKLKHKSSSQFDFSIIVKKYTEGLVSNYLFNLKKGDVTLWRGPYSKSYTIVPNIYNVIVMIGQGTGIVTLISIIDHILDDQDDFTKIHLIYCCKSIETILFRDELYKFKEYWNFTYEIFLSQYNECTNIKYQEPIVKRKFQVEDIPICSENFKNQYLLCGSESFMNAFKTYLLSKSLPPQNVLLL